MTIQTEYMFTAKITGKAETPNGTPYLQFAWRLPDAQYDLQLLLGRERDVYKAWNPGQVASPSNIHIYQNTAHLRSKTADDLPKFLDRIRDVIENHMESSRFGWQTQKCSP